MSGDTVEVEVGVLPLSVLMASPILHLVVTSWSSETPLVTCPFRTTV